MIEIGGIQPFSLSDFPGKTAAIVFTQGCNFRCPFCHNRQLFTREKTRFTEQEIFSFLQARKKQLSGIVISGGEPTIQEKLSEFIRAVKDFGYAVKLDTNGSEPDVIEKLLKNNLLDYIAMDIKAPFHLYDQLSGVAVNHDNIKKSIELIERGYVAYEFRTTFVKHMLKEKDISEICSSISSASKYKIQEFRELINI